MNIKRFTSVMFITFILSFNILLSISGSADEDIPTIINATYNIDLVNATYLLADLELYVSKITLSVGDDLTPNKHV